MKTDSLLELAENTNPTLIIMSNIFFM